MTPRGTEVVTRHTVPLELAPVNYHTSRSSALPGSLAPVENPGAGSGSDTITGSAGMMDSPLAQGAGFSLGDEVFDRVVRNGGRGGQAGFGRRRRWVVV